MTPNGKPVLALVVLLAAPLRFGVAETIGTHLTLEAYAGATFFTTNHDYFGGKVLEQAPFFEGQLHAIVNGITTRLGADYDTIQLAWQYAFGGRQ